MYCFNSIHILQIILVLFQLKLQEALKKREKFTKEHEEVINIFIKFMPYLKNYMS